MTSASRGIQSVDIALAVLTGLSRASGPLGLGDLATVTGMPPAKLHRYLASFVAAGYVTQRKRSGTYDLGPAALRLGVAAMARNDIINDVASALPLLTAETGATALLAVWGDQGATIVRWERAASFIVTTLGLGTTLPLLPSATGQVFLAFAPPGLTSARLEQELKTMPSADPVALQTLTRTQGYARTDGRFIPGLAAISAPVLNWQGDIEAAVTLVGTHAGMVADDSPELAALLDFCQRHSLNSASPPD
ncbi:MAG: IclR family transcriptional regulator [Rhodospirillales bacterium]